MRHRCQRHLLHNFNLNLNFSSSPSPPPPPLSYHAAAAMSRCCRNPPPHWLQMGAEGGRELFAFASFAFLIKREKYSKPFAIVSAIFKFNLHNIPNRRRASAQLPPSFSCCKFFRLLTIVLFASAAAAVVVTVSVSVVVVVALVADTI